MKYTDNRGLEIPQTDVDLLYESVWFTEKDLEQFLGKERFNAHGRAYYVLSLCAVQEKWYEEK